jgi:hypothetical protein
VVGRLGPSHADASVVLFPGGRNPVRPCPLIPSDGYLAGGVPLKARQFDRLTRYLHPDLPSRRGLLLTVLGSGALAIVPPAAPGVARPKKVNPVPPGKDDLGHQVACGAVPARNGRTTLTPIPGLPVITAARSQIVIPIARPWEGADGPSAI